MAERNLLVYRASAGSGKTHNLVFAFLRLLLLADDPRTVRQALAITFTRKASMEMKERILKQLRYMAMEPNLIFKGKFEGLTQSVNSRRIVQDNSKMLYHRH